MTATRQENLYCPACDEVRPSDASEVTNGEFVHFEVTCQACKSDREIHVGSVDGLREKHGRPRRKSTR